MNCVKSLLSFPVTIRSSKTAQGVWAACRTAYAVAWNCSTYLASLHYLTLVWIWASAFVSEHRWITLNEVLMRYDHLIIKLISSLGRGT